MSRFDLNSNSRFYDLDDDEKSSSGNNGGNGGNGGNDSNMGQNAKNSNVYQSNSGPQTGQFLPRGGFGAFRNVLENNSPGPGTGGLTKREINCEIFMSFVSFHPKF